MSAASPSHSEARFQCEAWIRTFNGMVVTRIRATVVSFDFVWNIIGLKWSRDVKVQVDFRTLVLYGFVEFNLIISPSTMNLPYPWWWMVFGFFCDGSVQALSSSNTNRLNLFTRRVSTTLHSRLAKHSASKAGATRSAGNGVKPNILNLSTSRPEQFPIPTTLGASSRAGTAITHSFVVRSAAKL